MKTRDLLDEALDRALQDRFSVMFGVLVTGIMAGEPSAISHFAAGVALLREARTVAQGVIADSDKVIPGK